jgi:pimeloyl-ACP methyl ester carboxylesterase
MATRRSFLAGGAALSLSVPFLGTPASLAQDATPAASPAAMAPPQDLLPADWGEVAGQTANINGIDIYYEVYGEGDPLLLIHGGLANGTYWANQIPAFAKDYQVIVMDSRGHGRSSFDETPISYDLMSSDVLGLLDHLEIPQTDLVGWSDGGIIGLDLALSNPDRLNKVVAYAANFDPSGVRLDIGSNDKFNAYIERASEDYQTTSPDPSRWDEFLNNISNMWATKPNWSMEQIASITTPFLILDGEDEEAIDLNQTKLMAVLMPNAELVLIPGTGHFAMFEKPEEFNRIVLNYLATGSVATPTA